MFLPVKKMKELKKVMTNVMAALRTYGIEYSVNVTGFDVQKDRKSLEGEVLEYPSKGFCDEFIEFVTRPHYNKVRGAWWAKEGDNHVLIQFVRSYEMDEADWQAYAGWCGCEDSVQAQCLYGDPPTSYIRKNVRVEITKLESFVECYAGYCWY